MDDGRIGCRAQAFHRTPQLEHQQVWEAGLCIAYIATCIESWAQLDRLID